jgi:hypothetical protein
MRGWYLPRDLLGVDGERVVPERFTLDQTVAFIESVAGLGLPPAVRPEPDPPTC